MSIRSATHAGSWYEEDEDKLNKQLSDWLKLAKPEKLPKLPHSVVEIKVKVKDEDEAVNHVKYEEDEIQIPIPNLKAIIAPHAGYSYSGRAAAWAYKCIDPKAFDRVFVLGPSHHVYVDGCMLTKCKYYNTPLGDLPIDQETTKELRQTGKFERDMDLEIDQDEHSIEMHLPYIRKIFEGQKIKLVPILVGSISASKEASFGRLLAPYLKDERTLFVISSDFCHWGSRFRFTHYQRSLETKIQNLQSNNPIRPEDPPIHASIRALDGQAIQELTFPASLPCPDARDFTGVRRTDISASESNKPDLTLRKALDAQKGFTSYLKATGNTICGRHPIGVLMGALAHLEENGTESELRFTRYEQSSPCENYRDSSVSYASAFVQFHNLA